MKTRSIPLTQNTVEKPQELSMRVQNHPMPRVTFERTYPGMSKWQIEVHESSSRILYGPRQLGILQAEAWYSGFRAYFKGDSLPPNRYREFWLEGRRYAEQYIDRLEGRVPSP